MESIYEELARTGKISTVKGRKTGQETVAPTPPKSAVPSAAERQAMTTRANSRALAVLKAEFVERYAEVYRSEITTEIFRTHGPLAAAMWLAAIGDIEEAAKLMKPSTAEGEARPPRKSTMRRRSDLVR